VRFVQQLHRVSTFFLTCGYCFSKDIPHRDGYQACAAFYYIFQLPMSCGKCLVLVKVQLLFLFQSFHPFRWGGGAFCYGLSGSLLMSCFAGRLTSDRFRGKKENPAAVLHSSSTDTAGVHVWPAGPAIRAIWCAAGTDLVALWDWCRWWSVAFHPLLSFPGDVSYCARQIASE